MRDVGPVLRREGLRTAGAGVCECGSEARDERLGVRSEPGGGPRAISVASTANTLVEAVWVVALIAGAIEGVEDRTSVVSI